MAERAVSCRIHARAADLGFSPPPLALRLKLVAGSGASGSLFVQCVPPGPLGPTLAWLEPFLPRRFDFGPTHVLRADFDPLPALWSRCFEDVRLDMLQLDPDGSAVVSVSGTRAAAAKFAASLEQRTHRLDIRHLAPAKPTAGILTPPQEAAILAALRHGYYEVPRPINLHELASKLDVSSASLSERLRRAEGRIIRRYAAGGDPWGARMGLDESVRSATGTPMTERGHPLE